MVSKKKNENKTKLILIFLVLFIFVISLITLLYFVNPEKIVERIGVENSYIFIFLVAFFAGFSSWTSFSLVTLLITLTMGGMNPVYLGLIAGVGLAIGDVIMFLTGSKGRELITGDWEKKLEKLAKFFEGEPKKLIPLVTYIYMGLTPLPNDFLMIFLSLIKYPLKKLYIPIILGDITYPLLITLLVTKGVMLLV